MSAPFTYSRQGRSSRSLFTVLAIWAGLLGLWIGVEAHPALLLLVIAFTLPACWDLLTNPASGMTLSDTEWAWHSGRRRAQVALDEVTEVRMNTRLDFSVKVTLLLRTGVRLVLPFEATPPDTKLEDALRMRGLRVHRTHFQLMQ